MFEALSERLNRTFKNLAGFGKITPENIDPAIREIRVALLEADVHFKVVKAFLDAVKTRALGTEVLDSITPADQFVKIVHDELARTLGAAQPHGGSGEITGLRVAQKPPTRILLCGLQGSGKTTAAAKLAHHLGESALVALDLQRPAAVEQLRVLASKVGAGFIAPSDPGDAVKSARGALAKIAGSGPDAGSSRDADSGRDADFRHVIFDTAGRLQIDETLMSELKAVHEAVQPHETILVLDAMVGQEAVKVADAFHNLIPLTGIILTKTDGDARGGAALSVRHVTGVPIKWVGTGESPQAFEAFHPERFAGRILGMGDVVSLVEKAARLTDQGKAEKMAKQMLDGDLDLEMFLEQIREMRKLGPMSEIISMLPGGAALKGDMAMPESEVDRFEAIILSMTPKERRNPDVIDASRRERIANGAGASSADVHRMLKQFRQARSMIAAMKGGARGRKAKAMKQFMSGGMGM